MLSIYCYCHYHHYRYNIIILIIITLIIIIYVLQLVFTTLLFILLSLLRSETPLWEWRFCPSVRPRFFVGAITFDRLEIFDRDFGYLIWSDPSQVKFVYGPNRTTPSGLTVKGHSNFKYKAPSCEVSLERSSKGLSNDI
jgi:hypothetical protein